MATGCQVRGSDHEVCRKGCRRDGGRGPEAVQHEGLEGSLGRDMKVIPISGSVYRWLSLYEQKPLWILHKKSPHQVLNAVVGVENLCSFHRFPRL